MNYLTIEKASKSFGEKILFHNLTLHINKGDKVALVAKNGTGKSTLLKVVAGLESVEGEQAKMLLHKDISVGFLTQEPQLDPHLTVIETMLSLQTKEFTTVKKYESALQSDDKELIERALADMDAHKAWNVESRVRELLYKFQLTEMHQIVGELSGGQLKRLAIARIILEQPDFLILDEPTNHLDLEMIEWLENHISQPNITVFMVTHDRYFLENVCNHILELDQGTIHKYQGSYADYLEKRSLRKEIEATTHEKNSKLLKHELEWVRRMPKARTTKAKDRIDRFYDLKEEVYGRKLEKELRIQLDVTRLGSKIIELHNVSKAFGPVKIISDFSYKFKKGERVGIVGKNGSGKSTLVRLLCGELKPDSGKIIIGETVVFGHYRQESLQLGEDLRVIDVIRNIAEYVPLKKGQKLTAEQLLERFLFSRSQQQVYVSQLSGGEKRRLHLLTILIKNPNVLILDEPTNDLDILTLNVLESYLMDFSGCLIIISHDRYFMDKLVDHLFVMKGEGELKDFPGTYTEFRRSVQTLSSDANTKSDKPKSERTRRPTMSYHEKKELASTEERIAWLENRKVELMNIFNSENPDEQQAMKLSHELGEIQSELEEKELRWLELMELKEGEAG